MRPVPAERSRVGSGKRCGQRRRCVWTPRTVRAKKGQLGKQQLGTFAKEKHNWKEEDVRGVEREWIGGMTLE